MRLVGQGLWGRSGLGLLFGPGLGVRAVVRAGGRGERAAAEVGKCGHGAARDELRGEARELREGRQRGRRAQQRRHVQLERKRPRVG